MDSHDQVLLNLKDKQIKYHEMLLKFLKGEDVDLDKMFEHQQSVIRLVCHSREININETRRVLQQAITPKIERMLKDMEIKNDKR